MAAIALVFGTALYLFHLGYFSSDPFARVAAVRPAAQSRRGTVAILMSGDMGFNVGMGPKVAKRLASDGIPVIGVNSLTYFRTRRTPEQATELIEQAMKLALASESSSTSERRVVVIGQSFGADMVNAGLARLPQEYRRHVLVTVLVVPTDTINFRASLSELLEWEKPDASALPTGRELGWVPTLCIYGREEITSLCPHLDPQRVTRLALPGGHKLEGNVGAVHGAILSEIDRALATRLGDPRDSPGPVSAPSSSPHSEPGR